MRFARFEQNHELACDVSNASSRSCFTEVDPSSSIIRFVCRIAFGAPCKTESANFNASVRTASRGTTRLTRPIARARFASIQFAAQQQLANIAFSQLSSQKCQNQARNQPASRFRITDLLVPSAATTKSQADIMPAPPATAAP